MQSAGVYLLINTLLLALSHFLCFLWWFLLERKKKELYITCKKIFWGSKKAHTFVQTDFTQWHVEIALCIASKVMFIEWPLGESLSQKQCTDDKAFYFYSFPLSQTMPRFSQLMWSERKEMKALAINPQPPPHLGWHTPEWGSHLPLSFLLKTSRETLEDHKSSNMLSLQSC